MSTIPPAAPRRLRPTRRGALAFVAGAVSALTLVGGGVAIAAIPSAADGSTTTCVNKSSGAMRAIDAQAGKKCSSSERTVRLGGPVVYRGSWGSGTSYKPGDVVVRSGATYLARSASVGKDPAAAAAQWARIAAAPVPGPQGPQGPAGAPGATGPQGPAGVSEVQVKQGTNLALSTAGYEIVSTMPLTAGSWLVQYSAQLATTEATTSSFVDCRLSLLSPGAQFSSGITSVTAPVANDQRTTVGDSVAGTIATSGTARLECRRNSTDVAWVQIPKLTAQRVGSVVIS